MSDLARRQVVLATDDLERTVDELGTVFGLEVCFVDPRVEHFGVRNSVLALGAQFLEVLQPLGDDTPAARYLHGRSGAGYMMVLQALTDRLDQDEFAELGVRVVHGFTTHDYRGAQLHPSDCGGVFLEIGRQRTADRDDPDGTWMPAGPRSTERDADAGRRLTGVQVEVSDAGLAAERLGALSGARPRVDGRRRAVPLVSGDVSFVVGPAAPAGGITAIDLEVGEPETALDSAPRIGLATTPTDVTLCGVRFRLAGPSVDGGR